MLSDAKGVVGRLPPGSRTSTSRKNRPRIADGSLPARARLQTAVSLYRCLSPARRFRLPPTLLRPRSRCLRRRFFRPLPGWRCSGAHGLRKLRSRVQTPYIAATAEKAPCVHNAFAIGATGSVTAAAISSFVQTAMSPCPSTDPSTRPVRPSCPGKFFFRIHGLRRHLAFVVIGLVPRYGGIQWCHQW